MASKKNQKLNKDIIKKKLPLHEIYFSNSKFIRLNTSLIKNKKQLWSTITGVKF